MPTYTCVKCEKTFTKKTDYNRHLARKIPCDDKPLDQLIDEKVEQKMAEILNRESESKSNDVKIIMNLVGKLHNIMYSSAISGQKAFYDIIRLLMLRFMEPHLEPNGKLVAMLNPDNYRDKIANFEDTDAELLKFDTLMNSSDVEEFEYNLCTVWNMLSLNTITQPIFGFNKSFNCKPETLKLCCEHISHATTGINFNNLDSDVGGDIYEYFTNYVKGGQAFGQFFTPRKLIQLIFKLTKEVFPEHEMSEDSTVYDPCAGTGGFLMQMFKYANIHPDNIHGGELEPDTYATGVINLLLATGSIKNFTNGNSFQSNNLQKFDWICTNPPFGVKTKYKDVLKNVKLVQPIAKKGQPAQAPTCIPADKMYPVEINDGCALFLQHCIAKLAEGGVCSIVVPDGQLLTGKKSYSRLREYLTGWCQVRAVLKVPGNIFTNTSIQTAVLFFRNDPTDATDSITFYETNKDCTGWTQLGKVDHEELAANDYSLNWKSYKQSENQNHNWETKTLGDLYTFNRGKFNSNDMDSKGDIPFYSCKAKNPVGFHSEFSFDYPEYLLLVSSGGSKNNLDGDGVGLGNCYLVSGKTACRANVYALVPNENNQVLTQYTRLYIANNKYKLNSLASFTTNLGVISLESIKSFEIPVPSLEKQQEIIDQCDKFDNNVKHLQELIGSLENSKSIISAAYIEPLFKSTEVKTLGDVCSITYGTRIVKSDNKEGPYNVYGGGNATFTTDQFNRSGQTCKISRFGLSAHNCVQILNESYYLNDSGFTIESTDETNLLNKYLWYFLFMNMSNIYKLAYGTAQKNINIEEFNNMEIPIPSLEKQQEIVKKYDTIYGMMSIYENSITDIKNQKEHYLATVFTNHNS